MDGCDRAGKFYQALVDDLCSYAERAWREGRKLTGGGTEAEHADVADAVFANLPGARSAKAAAPAAALPDLPAAAAYLWDWFGELSLGLASGGFGPAVVTWEGVRAWRELMRLELDPWEVRALVRLGNLRAEVLAEDQPKPKAK